jgi:uncharacterized integral membrane protein
MWRALLLAPFLLLLVAFVLSNQQPVTLALWPFDVTLANIPLSLAVLAVAALFFMLGALIVWIPALATRRRARLAQKRVVHLETKLKAHEKSNPNVKLLAGPR